MGHHRLPSSSAPSHAASPPAPPAPAPSPSPVNLTAHKEDKERLAPTHSLGYPYAHYPMAAPMFPPTPYSPYATRLPPPSDAPAAYSPPAGSPAPLPLAPPPVAPKATVASRTFKVPVPAKDSPLKHRILAQPKHHPAASVATPLPPLPAPVATPAPLSTTTALPQHPLASASSSTSAAVDFRPQDYQTSTGTASAATTQPQFWKGSLIR